MANQDDPAFQDDGTADETAAADHVAAARRRVRENNIRDIRDLYGVEYGPGRDMLMDVLARYALDFLPDNAIDDLAEQHRQRDDRGS